MTTSIDNSSVCQSQHRAASVSAFVVKQLVPIIIVGLATLLLTISEAWCKCSSESLWTFTGLAAGDYFGRSVSGAGDVNNDGYADLIVGADGNNAGGTWAGRAYVLSGQTGTLLWTFTGQAAYDYFGYSVSGAGDVNNDGYDDLIVGAHLNDAGGNNAGRAYVYSGQTGALLWTFTGEATGDEFGYSVSGAGDVNNDGYADLIVGAYLNDAGGTMVGRAYVYSGQTGALLWTFTGEAASDWFGVSVSGAGDVNNDGYDDLIVGAYGNDAGGNDAGRAYVYPGQAGEDYISGDANGYETPDVFELSQNYPNPFNPETEISYMLPNACQVDISIYNLLGQRVRILVYEFQSAGVKNLKWDGRDEYGVSVASGVYFYRIKAGEFAESKKMVILK